MEYLILRTNRDSILKYNHMVLAATFRVNNNIFAEQLRTAVQENETTQTILKKISQGDVEKFIKKDRFLLF